MDEKVGIGYLLEEKGFRSWPAKIQKPYYEWILRITDGKTKRANSVYTVGSMPVAQDWLTTIEDYYISRKIDPCFYISNYSPTELESLLEKNGYEILYPCFVMAASVDAILAAVNKDDRFEISLSSVASSDWIHEFIELENYTLDRKKEYQTIFSNMKEKQFIRVLEKSEPVGLGTIVVDGDWACISNIIVHSSHRRKGIAAQILRALTSWAQENGANHIFLQVLQENQGAINLYQKLGFQVVSEHHYRGKVIISHEEAAKC